QYGQQSLLFVAVVALVWGSAGRRIDFRTAGRNADFRFFAVQAVTAFLIVLAVVVAFGIDGISSHHPASLLLSLPIVAVLALDASSLLAGGESLWRKRLFVGAAAACVIAIWAILALSLVYVFPGRFPSYAPLARAIEGAAGAEAAVIAESYSIGGPLRARQSRFTVNAANLATRVPVQNPPRPVPCVAVWWEQGDGAPPASLVGYVEHLTGNAWRNPGIDSTLVRGAGESRPERADLRFEILPASAACAAPSGSAG
ncbi:MAG: hypothetical protein ACRED5_16650, partial [Propylenella sp.]